MNLMVSQYTDNMIFLFRFFYNIKLKFRVAHSRLVLLPYEAYNKPRSKIHKKVWKSQIQTKWSSQRPHASLNYIQIIYLIFFLTWYFFNLSLSFGKFSTGQNNDSCFEETCEVFGGFDKSVFHGLGNVIIFYHHVYFHIFEQYFYGFNRTCLELTYLI